MTDKLIIPGIYQEQYSGYIIAISSKSFEYKIIETLSTGKKKVRRHCNGVSCNPRKRDRFGNELLHGFKDFEHSLQTARNFIDNYIVPWEEKRESFGFITPKKNRASVTLTGKPNKELINALGIVIDLAYKNLP